MRCLTQWLVAGCIASAAPAWPAPAQTFPAPLIAQDQAAIDAALELYSARLLQTAMQHRGYPARALEQRLSGVADIEITIGADGKLQQKSLAGGTHHRVLDEHALQLIEQAVPITAIPSALSGHAFRVKISVNYAIPE